MERLPSKKVYLASLEQLNCSICLEPYDNDKHAPVEVSDCRHILGKNCLTTWLESHNTCPLCRRELFTPPRKWEISWFSNMVYLPQPYSYRLEKDADKNYPGDDYILFAAIEEALKGRVGYIDDIGVHILLQFGFDYIDLNLDQRATLALILLGRFKQTLPVLPEEMPEYMMLYTIDDDGALEDMLHFHPEYVYTPITQNTIRDPMDKEETSITTPSDKMERPSSDQLKQELIEAMDDYRDIFLKLRLYVEKEKPAFRCEQTRAAFNVKYSSEGTHNLPREAYNEWSETVEKERELPHSLAAWEEHMKMCQRINQRFAAYGRFGKELERLPDDDRRALDGHHLEMLKDYREVRNERLKQQEWMIIVDRFRRHWYHGFPSVKIPEESTRQLSGVNLWAECYGME